MNLFSHSDQQAQWQNGAPLGGQNTGWAGRLVDRIYVPGCSASSSPVSFGNQLPTIGVKAARRPPSIPGLNRRSGLR